MITFDEATAIVAECAKPLSAEHISLDDADGRVLANPIVARFASPCRPTSAMDGYAVRENDLVHAPVMLDVVGISYAGASYPELVHPGTCVRIFTGADLPDGANHVVIQEDVSERNGKALFAQPASPRHHIRQVGSDFEAGDILLPKGAVLNPQRLVAVAAADSATVEVVRRPRVLIIACGDELVPPGMKAVSPNKIADSLSPAIAALVRRWGGTVIDCALCPDDIARLQEVATTAVERADVVVVIGGASVGQRDFAKAMFAPLGLHLQFEKVAIKPGKPVWFGMARGALIMGLPGNPTSALVTARLFLAPLLSGLAGAGPQAAWQWLPHQMATRLEGCLEREVFLRAAGSGQGLVPLLNQDSAAQKNLADAAFLIRLRAGADAIDAGQFAETIPF